MRYLALIGRPLSLGLFCERGFLGLSELEVCAVGRRGFVLRDPGICFGVVGGEVAWWVDTSGPARAARPGLQAALGSKFYNALDSGVNAGAGTVVTFRPREPKVLR